MVLFSAAPAAAQVGPPVRLVPQMQPSAPPVAGGSGGSGTSAPAPHERRSTTTSDDITAAPLGPADASWSGTLSEDDGGFPPSLWRGTSREFLSAALPLMAPSTSPVLQDLARRLLLSNGLAPAGRDAPDRPPLAVVRLDRLMALGDVEGALGLLDLLPPDPSGDGLDRARIELKFAASDHEGACAGVSDAIARYTTPWWQRALIACQALEGDGAKSSLGLSLLREQKAPPDPVFDTLIETLGGQKHKIEKLPDPTPLRVSLLAATQQPLPAEALANAWPAALLAYATSAGVPLQRRLAAGERAALFGALPAERLGELYAGVEAPSERQTAALAEGKLPEDAMSRAVLYDVARSSAPAKTRAAAIAALLVEARKRVAFPLVARLLVDAIGELRPAETSPEFAGEAARALLVAGKQDAARPWIEAAGSKELTLVSTLVVPPPDAWDPAAALHDAIAELAEHRGGAAPAQADLLLALLASFDLRLATTDWAVLLAPPHAATVPSAVLWIDQEQAAAGKRVGETVLATILMLQSGERLALEPMLLSRAIAGLRAVGRESNARALALEAAIDAGL
jgi:hypothetical protein